MWQRLAFTVAALLLAIKIAPERTYDVASNLINLRFGAEIPAHCDDFACKNEDRSTSPSTELCRWAQRTIRPEEYRASLERTVHCNWILIDSARYRYSVSPFWYLQEPTQEVAVEVEATKPCEPRTADQEMFEFQPNGSIDDESSSADNDARCQVTRGPIHLNERFWVLTILAVWASLGMFFKGAKVYGKPLILPASRQQRPGLKRPWGACSASIPRLANFIKDCEAYLMARNKERRSTQATFNDEVFDLLEQFFNEKTCSQLYLWALEVMDVTGLEDIWTSSFRNWFSVHRHTCTDCRWVHGLVHSKWHNRFDIEGAVERIMKSKFSDYTSLHFVQDSIDQSYSPLFSIDSLSFPDYQKGGDPLCPFAYVHVLTEAHDHAREGLKEDMREVEDALIDAAATVSILRDGQRE